MSLFFIAPARTWSLHAPLPVSCMAFVFTLKTSFLHTHASRGLLCTCAKFQLGSMKGDGETREGEQRRGWGEFSLASPFHRVSPPFARSHFWLGLVAISLATRVSANVSYTHTKDELLNPNRRGHVRRGAQREEEYIFPPRLAFFSTFPSPPGPCHVILSKSWFSPFPPPLEDELGKECAKTRGLWGQ